MAVERVAVQLLAEDFIGETLEFPVFGEEEGREGTDITDPCQQDEQDSRQRGDEEA